ncbi:hypothetical protein [Qipengyuania sp.]|uniref:hypothetical protein n=1 Tax=Qipengyuania sp. TaxID=2004515 RepID=UPI0035C7FDC6
MSWLVARGAFGLARWAWLAIAVTGLVLIAWAAIDRLADTVETATETGRTIGGQEQVIAGQARTLDQLGDAKNAQTDLRSAGERSAARYEQCLLDSDRPAACERYRPGAQE